MSGWFAIWRPDGEIRGLETLERLRDGLWPDAQADVGLYAGDGFALAWRGDEGQYGVAHQSANGEQLLAWINRGVFPQSAPSADKDEPTAGRTVLRWNADTRKLRIGAECTGSAPVFYRMTSEFVIFSGCAAGVLAFSETQPEPDYQTLVLFLELGSVPAPFTGIRDLRQVIPDRWVSVHTGEKGLRLTQSAAASTLASGRYLKSESLRGHLDRSTGKLLQPRRRVRILEADGAAAMLMGAVIDAGAVPFHERDSAPRFGSIIAGLARTYGASLQLQCMDRLPFDDAAEPAVTDLGAEAFAMSSGAYAEWVSRCKKLVPEKWRRRLATLSGALPHARQEDLGRVMRSLGKPNGEPSLVGYLSSTPPVVRAEVGRCAWYHLDGYLQSVAGNPQGNERLALYAVARNVLIPLAGARLRMMCAAGARVYAPFLGQDAVASLGRARLDGGMKLFAGGRGGALELANWLHANRTYISALLNGSPELSRSIDWTAYASNLKQLAAGRPDAARTVWRLLNWAVWERALRRFEIPETAVEWSKEAA